MDASTHTLDASARPYLLRALHQWCSDEGLTPYVAVWVDERVEVPRDFVQDNQIVLNVGYDATRDLHIDNDVLSFKGRFGGVARDVMVPVTHVLAIYAKETGQGMVLVSPDDVPPVDPSPPPDTDAPAPPPGRPVLRRVK